MCRQTKLCLISGVRELVIPLLPGLHSERLVGDPSGSSLSYSSKDSKLLRRAPGIEDVARLSKRICCRQRSGRHVHLMGLLYAPRIPCILHLTKESQIDCRAGFCLLLHKHDCSALSARWSLVFRFCLSRSKTANLPNG